VRPHDVRITPGAPPGSIYATIERVASLGWLARVTLRFPDERMIVAHVPQDELAGAKVGDTISVDLRNPKAFHREDAISAEKLETLEEDVSSDEGREELASPA
jgi:hypothetical protein